MGLDLLSCPHALHAPLLVECHPRAPPHPLAQPLSIMENRNLHRREDAPDRSAGILGIYLAGAQTTLALPEVDRRNGALRPSQSTIVILSERSLRSEGSGRATRCVGFFCDANNRAFGADPYRAAAAAPSITILTSLPLPDPINCAAAARLAAISRYPMLPRMPNTSLGMPSA